MLSVNNPYDGSLLQEIPYNSAADVDRALSVAYKLFNDREQWLPAYQRIEILERVVEIMQSQVSELTKIAALEGGKPFNDTEVEVYRAINGVKLALEHIPHNKGEEIPMGHTQSSANRLAFTRREPIGVVSSVSAFNHPLNLIVHQTVPAIAVGAPVLIKPATTTPMSCLRFVEILHEAGLPESWCQALVVKNEDAEKLVTDDRVNFFSFIGSAGVGWSLRSKLSPGTRCALEHGGVAPVIVDASADLTRGDPLDPKTEVGPLILPREVDRVASWVDEAKAGGAEVLCGGRKISDTCYAPTVLLNPPEDAKVSQNEVFGPVVCIYSYKDKPDAIARANALSVAFQASIYTNDLTDALDTSNKLNATAVMVNDHTAFRVDWMPFGGRDTSGLGMGGIQYSMHEMTREKMLVIKSDVL